MPKNDIDITQIHTYDYIYTFLYSVTVLLEMRYINKLLTYITVFDYHSFITLQCTII